MKTKTQLFGVVDKGISGFASLLMVMAVARLCTAAEFGSISLLLVIITVFSAGYRAVPGTWLVTDRGTDTTSEWTPRGAMELAALLSLLPGLLILLVGFSLQVSPLVTVCASAVSLPYVIVDCIRLSLYSKHKTGVAAALSVSVVALFGAALLLCGRPSALNGPALPILAFGAAHALVVGAAASFRLLSVSAKSLPGYIARNRGDWKGQTWSFGLSAGAQLILPYVLFYFGGGTLVAAIRGAQTLAALPQQIPQGLYPVHLAAASKHWAEHHSMPPALLRRWARNQTVLMAPLVCASVFVPDALGIRLLGDTWFYAKPVLPIVLASALFTQVLLGYEIVLRATDRMREMIKVRLATLAAVLGLVTAGSLVAGPVGAAFGLSVANLSGLVLVSRVHSIRGLGRQLQ